MHIQTPVWLSLPIVLVVPTGARGAIVGALQSGFSFSRPRAVILLILLPSLCLRVALVKI